MFHSDVGDKDFFDVTDLEDLVSKLRLIYDQKVADNEAVKRLLKAYKSCENDWQRYAIFDADKYTRNLVNDGNGKYNLMVLCWSEGVGSSIHDHSNADCFVKVLSGVLKESQYEWPKYLVEQRRKGAVIDLKMNSDNQMADEALQLKNVNLYEENQVTYINDDIGLHRMENPNHATPTVTLHLYVPPFRMCHTFEDRSGKIQERAMTFNSVYGRKVVDENAMIVEELCSSNLAIASH